MAQKVPFSHLDRVGIGPTTTATAAPSTRCLLAVHKRREIPARAERKVPAIKYCTAGEGKNLQKLNAAENTQKAHEMKIRRGLSHALDEVALLCPLV